MTDMKRYAIVVAGGSGKRMKSELPKQFLEINGKAILMHTLERFHQYDKAVGLIAVLPKEHIPTWKKLCRNANFVIPHKIVEGGPERFFSVKNGYIISLFRIILESINVAPIFILSPFADKLLIFNVTP